MTNPAFQRRHYQAIADAIKAERDSNGAVNGFSSALDSHRLADRLVSLFASDNPNFDRARFLKACGVEA
jgi:hypothetical protein